MDSNEIDITCKSEKYRISFVPFFGSQSEQWCWTRFRWGACNFGNWAEAAAPKGCAYISPCIEGHDRWTEIRVGRHNQKIGGTSRHIRPKVEKKRQSSCHWTTSQLESYEPKGRYLAQVAPIEKAISKCKTAGSRAGRSKCPWGKAFTRWGHLIGRNRHDH